MNKVIAASAAAAALVLGGCIKISNTLPTNLPPYVTIMPGAHQMMTMDMGPMKAEVYQTSASIPDVVAYYRARAQSDGLGPQPSQTHANAKTGEQQVAFAAGPRLLIVNAKPQNGATLVTLAYRSQAKRS